MKLPRCRTVRTASAKVERTRTDQCRVFSQRMPGSKVGVQAGFRLQGAQSGDADGQDGRLGVGGQAELLLGAFETELGQIEAESLVGLGKYLTSRRKIIG